jgi:hypothetical protein
MRAREENKAMESQIVELLSGSTDMGDTIKELEDLNEEMQRALDWSRNLSYLALGVSLIVVVMAMLVLGKR